MAETRISVFAMSAGDPSNDARPDARGQAERQPLPDRDRGPILRIVRCLVNVDGRTGVPVFPDERPRLGAPLPLELKGALTRCATPELKRGASLLDRKLQH